MYDNQTNPAGRSPVSDAEFQLKVKALIKSREQLKAQNADLMRQLSELQTELMTRQSLLDELGQAKARLEMRVAEMDSLMEQNKQLMARVAEMDSLTGQNKQLLARVAEMDSLMGQNNQLMARVDELERQRQPAPPPPPEPPPAPRPADPFEDGFAALFGQREVAPTVSARCDEMLTRVERLEVQYVQTMELLKMVVDHLGRMNAKIDRLGRPAQEERPQTLEQQLRQQLSQYSS